MQQSTPTISRNSVVRAAAVAYPMGVGEGEVFWQAAICILPASQPADRPAAGKTGKFSQSTLWDPQPHSHFRVAHLNERFNKLIATFRSRPDASSDRSSSAVLTGPRPRVEIPVDGKTGHKQIQPFSKFPNRCERSKWVRPVHSSFLEVLFEAMSWTQ